MASIYLGPICAKNFCSLLLSFNDSKNTSNAYIQGKSAGFLEWKEDTHSSSKLMVMICIFLKYNELFFFKILHTLHLLC